MSLASARDVVEQLGPVVGFLAAVFVLADGCADEGLFRAAGAAMARAGRRSAPRLLLAVVAIAAVTTAALSLDTTVVLLTPVVVASVRAADAPPRPPLYATAHLANSASLLLPVSNLTNLLAFAVVPVSFARFTGLMLLPWLLVIAVEVAGLWLVFGRDLSAPLRTEPVPSVRVPVFATCVVVLTVIGFGVAETAGVEAVWVAGAGAAVLSAHRLLRRRTGLWRIVRATSPVFCLGVLALGIVIRAISDAGLGGVVRDVMPVGSGLPALLGVAAVGAVLANLVNNLPATLLLLPVAATGGIGPVLAVLVGVNVGPNLTYHGSLATLLWRRSVAGVEGVPCGRDYLYLGVVTTPVAVVLATVGVWLGLLLSK